MGHLCCNSSRTRIGKVSKRTRKKQARPCRCDNAGNVRGSSVLSSPQKPKGWRCHLGGCGWRRRYNQSSRPTTTHNEHTFASRHSLRACRPMQLREAGPTPVNARHHQQLEAKWRNAFTLAVGAKLGSTLAARRESLIASRSSASSSSISGVFSRPVPGTMVRVHGTAIHEAVLW